jgi:hypothetical protein
MNEQELKAYLSKNLSAQVKTGEDWSGKTLSVTLVLEGKEISRSEVEIVNKFEQSKGVA